MSSIVKMAKIAPSASIVYFLKALLVSKKPFLVGFPLLPKREIQPKNQVSDKTKINLISFDLALYSTLIAGQLR